MSTFEVLEKTPLSMSELKSELKRIEKRDSELGFRSSKTADYLNNFSLVSKKDAESMQAEIVKLEVPRLKSIHIIKIIDLMPKSAEELKVFLSGYGLAVNNENLKRIVDVVAKHSPEK